MYHFIKEVKRGSLDHPRDVAIIEYPGIGHQTTDEKKVTAREWISGLK